MQKIVRELGATIAKNSEGRGQRVRKMAGRKGGQPMHKKEKGKGGSEWRVPPEDFAPRNYGGVCSIITDDRGIYACRGEAGDNPQTSFLVGAERHRWERKAPWRSGRPLCYLGSVALSGSRAMAPAVHGVEVC